MARQEVAVRDLLAAFAEGRGWEPLSVPLRGPAAGEIAERLAEVQAWAAEWTRAGSGRAARCVSSTRRSAAARWAPT